LHWAEPNRIFTILRVARAHVVEDAITKDVFTRILALDVLTLTSDYDAKFEFKVQLFAIARPEDVRASANHAEAIALVINGLLVPDRRYLELVGLGQFDCGRLRIGKCGGADAQRLGPRLPVMEFEGEEVAHLPRHRNRCEQLHVG